MDRAKIVDYYLEKINDKDFSILNVRQELEKNNVDEQEIKVIVRLVDNELQRRLKNKTTGDSSKELIWFGGISLGFTYFVTNKIGLDLEIQGIGFRSTTPFGFNGYEGSDYIFGISSFMPILGFKYYFSK